ncbi:hypothetical protein P8452_48501 [Trifolium repens]|nr:hypothetical protein P8452_48501 [Trifolium repens]
MLFCLLFISATEAIIKDPPMVCETDADCLTSWDPNFDIKCIENKCEWARKKFEEKLQVNSSGRAQSECRASRGREHQIG